jgi:ribonuclease Z
MSNVRNPYGGGPGTGITLPPYYKPTKYMKNNNYFIPGLEEVGPDEMRVSFVGSCPYPSRRDQGGTSIMVELGNGDIFFFDLGNGAMKNIIAMGVPQVLVNDIFITHLHVDHYADLPYMLPFTASGGRYKPLRVTGPSGRIPELGTKAMIENMRKMLRWHIEEFDFMPMGDGCEVEVNEFDFREENGICYDKNGVTVRHWPRSHGKDGASAYRLDWNGLSFVWTGDGRPDELTVKYSQGADVFVTEVQNDLGNLAALKYGYPPAMWNYVIDTHHTTHFAAGYLFKEINPRVGMVTHLEYEPELNNEVIAGIRTHWDGLFILGAPDVRVVNVTKDSIYARDAVLPELGAVPRPNPQVMLKAYGLEELPDVLEMPPAKLPREEQQIEYLREIEIDPQKYTPADVNRELVLESPQMKFNIKEMLAAQQKAQEE